MPIATNYSPPGTGQPVDKYDAPLLLGNQPRRRYRCRGPRARYRAI